MKKETDAEREERWQAESDSYTLTRYGEIAQDKDRLKRALAYVEKQKEALDITISSFDS